MKPAFLKTLFPLLLLLGFYTYLLARPINLTTIDLGRHLINGREIIQGNLDVLFKNTYSYTMPNQPFINHHWLSGVIFFLVYSAGGFLSLHLLHTLVLLATFSLLFYILKNHSDQWIAFSLGSLAVLFFASRTEIRPESFGFALLLIYLQLINLIRKNKQLSGKTITVLLILQIIWTNLHISFIFGPFVFGLLWLSFKKLKKDPLLTKKILLTTVGLGLVTIINPNGLIGSLAPLAIFEDYGYRIFENQNLWFLRDFYRGPIIPLFYLSSLTMIANSLFFRIKNKLFDKWLATIGVVLGFLALRNIPIFVIFSFPLLAGQLKQISNQWKKNPPIKIESPQLFSAVLLTGVFIFSFSLAQLHPVFGKHPSQPSTFGLIGGQQEMMNFLDGLPAGVKIFNNYDIGSTLVFTLYPETLVFVDNRPEAFSSEFFQELYIPMQKSERVWQQALETFNFQYLIIGHRDITEWTQAFIKARLEDPDWQTIYQDSFIIIFSQNS